MKEDGRALNGGLDQVANQQTPHRKAHAPHRKPCHHLLHAYTCTHTHMHTHIHTCIHTHIHTYMHTCMHAYRQRDIQTDGHEGSVAGSDTHQRNRGQKQTCRHYRHSVARQCRTAVSLASELASSRARARTRTRTRTRARRLSGLCMCVCKGTGHREDEVCGER